ncbi:hypothetical protein LO762_25425 [Actinocorallia sp. API 0066]|uniref:hypothetical protein n=1 Tax=Actinocorallia sp. API 0066 TaxID=2896846 RepID=UPI001E55E984|nr:hypothetical protein [Actinocorallia sp. API 0066]MCD0452500.1 hypothetical protein [Actinocorallia sp. API 0066]
MERQPNTKLANLIAEAEVSHLGLASRITAVAEEWRENIRPAHTQVARWIAGQQPRGTTPALIAEALSRKLRRRVTLADIGMDNSTDAPETGLDFVESAEELISGIGALWTADVQRRRFLTGKVAAVSISHPAFQWLLAAPASRPERAGSQQIGMSEVLAIRATTAMFAGLDNRFGGAHSRTAAIQYLTDQVTPLLNGSYTSAVGTALFSAVAEFNLTVGWMAYDTGLHGLARRYLVQALNLSHHAGDRQLGASVLSAMSHQANYLGEHTEALTFARAATQAIHDRPSALLEAQFAAMQARAAAAIPGRESECLSALATAEAAFIRHRPCEGPEWIAYFDESELSDEFAHCFRDLNRPAEARRYAMQCLDAETADYSRSRTFSRLVLAAALLSQNELEEACVVVTAALPRIQETGSTRCRTYLRDLRTRLNTHADHPDVRELMIHISRVLRPTRPQ